MNVNGTQYEKVAPDILYERLAFAGREYGIFNLTDESQFKNSGTYINNFCEIPNPSLGAFQSDTDVIPKRPFDMYADKQYISLSDNFVKLSLATTYHILGQYTQAKPLYIELKIFH